MKFLLLLLLFLALACAPVATALGGAAACWVDLPRADGRGLAPVYFSPCPT